MVIRGRPHGGNLVVHIKFLVVLIFMIVLNISRYLLNGKDSDFIVEI